MKFRHKSLMGLIYCCLLALPFVAILSRVIYVQSNKNAYQSYSNQYQLETPTELIAGQSYKCIITERLTNVESFNIIIENDSINNLETNTTPATSTISRYQIGGDSSYYYLSIGTEIYNNFEGSFDFVYKSGSYDNLLPYLKQYTQNSYLDNVFEYSVNKFIENNNFGRINLFQWTTDLFFDSNNVNNMYVGFINWYLNYTMLVSTTYILFLVLMWFVNYARRLLERGMNYDW